MTYRKYCNGNIILYCDSPDCNDFFTYDEQDSFDYSNNELDIDSTAIALQNKFKSSDNYSLDEEIEYMSAGSEAEVFSIGNKAVKVFCKKNPVKNSYDDLKNELEKQQSFLQGINGLAKPLKTDTVEINGKNYPIQISKYMEHGSLFDIINYDNDYIREESSRFRISIKLALIVSNLHQMGLVHNDLKPENIFLNHNNNVKIGDFSFIVEIDNEEREPLGTMGYFAPELINFDVKKRKKFKPSLAVDIYALGVIFFQLFLPNRYECWDNFYNTNIQNYKKLYGDDQQALAECYLGYCKNFINILKNIKKNTNLDLYELKLYSGWKEPREKLADLILGMLEINPKKRLNIEQVKEKLAEIFKLTEKDYNHIKKPIKLKSREFLDLGIINKNLNFEKKEIEKMEKNLLLRIKTIFNITISLLESNVISMKNGKTEFKEKELLNFLVGNKENIVSIITKLSNLILKLNVLEQKEKNNNENDKFNLNEIDLTIIKKYLDENLKNNYYQE